MKAWADDWEPQRFDATLQDAARGKEGVALTCDVVYPRLPSRGFIADAKRLVPDTSRREHVLDGRNGSGFDLKTD